jgi:CheY-like chemotaxis protein
MTRDIVVFLAEDKGPKDVADSLRLKLSDHIPNLRIDFAATVEAGQATIQGYTAMPYCAVLDYMLPQRHVGEESKGDRTLCLLLRDRWRERRQPHIIHVSGYSTQDDLQRHIAEAHRGHFDQVSAIAKGPDGAWIQLTAQRILALYFEDTITEKLAALFPREASEAGIDMWFARDAGKPGSITMPLLDLTLEIGAHWKFLPAPFQAKLEKIFEIDPSVDPVTVDLKRPPASPPPETP